MPNLQDQDRQWSRHASRYDELFLDALNPDVVNPLLVQLEQIPDPERLTVADLGCGTGPLLPRLVGRFGQVVALDFAPDMIACARDRLGPANAKKVTFETRPMHDLDGYAGQFDVAIAINSLVMPDVRVIDQTLKAIHGSLRPGGLFMGVVPSIDAIHYHTMLLMDQALDRGLSPEEAERTAAFHAEHQYYEFAFGRFKFLGLRQKFWQPFEIQHRLTKAGFASIELDQVLYPWDESMAGGTDFADHPRSWDWSFRARA
ncbi:class I SAM-dependent methyltransferase [Singulisphaera sp. PoT]|uniref:class I SAM-dependent methyltransferase n=1 Tax=Singulisphaera sp. PoT TaxID=3411797 RepID=UPI003BF47D93